MRQRGLTVIELLAIIFVIGILAFLLLPSMVRDGHPGPRVVCRWNLQRIGQGCVLYSHDFGDYFPTVKDPGGESRPLPSLSLLFDAYVPMTATFVCPSTEDVCRHMLPRGTLDRHGYEKVVGPQLRCSYAYDDTRDPKASKDIVIAGDAPPTMQRKPDVRTQGTFSEKNSDNHYGLGQNVLFYDCSARWIANTLNPRIPGDDIYTAADPKNPGVSDSYIHQ